MVLLFRKYSTNRSRKEAELEEMRMGKSQDSVKAPDTLHPGFFQHGNVRIVILEHFASQGRTMAGLMENVILHEAKQCNMQKNLKHHTADKTPQ